MTKKIGFIGAGNMAQAMITGLISGGTAQENIMASSPEESIHEICGKGYGIKTTNSNETLVDFADVIIIAIKPQLFEAVLPPLAAHCGGKLIISVAAGVTIDTITELLGNDTIVRCMPNTPALVQEGATGMFASPDVSEEDKHLAESLLSTTGFVTWVAREDLIHAVTAVSGSAPAYFFHMMEAIIAEGHKMGLTQEQSRELALQTAYGAAKMARSSDKSPTTLREQVTSPNGTTHAAIESMRANKFEQTVATAMQACVARSKEMAGEYPPTDIRITSKSVNM